MPRSRKILDMQKGHVTKNEIQKRQEEEKCVVIGNNQLKTAPKWLVDDIAKKEWRRVIKELNGISMIGNLDMSSIGGYCNAYSNYIKATEELNNSDLILERYTKNGKIYVKNPIIDIQKSFAVEMRAFAGQCGMTIDSRLKAAVVKTEKTQETIKQKFGNI